MRQPKKSRLLKPRGLLKDLKVRDGMRILKTRSSVKGNALRGDGKSLTLSYSKVDEVIHISETASILSETETLRFLDRKIEILQVMLESESQREYLRSKTAKLALSHLNQSVETQRGTIELLTWLLTTSAKKVIVRFITSQQYRKIGKSMLQRRQHSHGYKQKTEQSARGLLEKVHFLKSAGGFLDVAESHSLPSMTSPRLQKEGRDLVSGLMKSLLGKEEPRSLEPPVTTPSDPRQPAPVTTPSERPRARPPSNTLSTKPATHKRPAKPNSGVLETMPFPDPNAKSRSNKLATEKKKTSLRERSEKLIKKKRDSSLTSGKSESDIIGDSKKFHFVLRGRSAWGNTMKINSAAKLIFNYGVPPLDVLAMEGGQDLEMAMKESLDIVLIVTVVGAIKIEGKYIGIARFKSCRLRKPVEFSLSSQDVPGKAQLHIRYLINGELIHQSEISVEVVEKIDSSPRKDIQSYVVAPLDLGLKELINAVSPAPKQRIAMSLSYANGYLRICLIEYLNDKINFEQEYQSTSLRDVHLEALLQRINTDLSNCYADEDVWANYDGSIPGGEEGTHIISALADARETLAVAGSRLNGDLRGDNEIAASLEYIEENGTDGAVLSITTDNIFLPWEILYPKHRSKKTIEERYADPLQVEMFWGVRFAIETEKRGTGSLIKLRDAHVKNSPKISLNLNPAIDIKNIPEDKGPLFFQRAWAETLEQRGYLDGLQETCKEMRRVLQNAGSNDATFIYVYCHGSAPDVTAGRDEKLVLADGCELAPRDLCELPIYRNAPIIFLNSCKAGVSSPMVSASFLKEFRARGALGLIATSHSVPIAFGARFGREVAESYILRSQSLAIEMLLLRRKHLISLGNPIPLFYTLQCHLDAIYSREKNYE